MNIRWIFNIGGPLQDGSGLGTSAGIEGFFNRLLNIFLALQDIWWIIGSFVFAHCECIAEGNIKGRG
jgi:hypothetical protein